MDHRPPKRPRTSTSTKPTLSPLFEGDYGRQDEEDISRRSRPSRAWPASDRDPNEVFAFLDFMVEWKRREEQEEFKRKNEMEREREREIYFSVTKDEQMLSDAEGVKRFQIFEGRVRSLDLKLQSFQNAVGQLGSGVGLLNAARQLKDRLAQLEVLFRRNVSYYMYLGDKGTYLAPLSLAAELFGEIPHPPMNKSTSNKPTEGTTKRRSVGNPAAPYNAPIIENLPNELQLLAGNLKTLLDRLNEVPEFTDEAVNSPIKAFQDDLQYRFSCLREFEEQLKVLAVARYINDLTEDLGSHMDNMKNSLNIFIDVGVPTIRFYQTHGATGLQNLSTVATFLSGVTATTLQFSYQSRGQLLPDSVNALWISSLVLSIASAINSQLAYHWRVAMYRSPNHYVPGWVSIWITHTPLFFLVISVIAFSVGLCAFTYSSDQSRAVSTLVTAFTAITSLALLCVGLWFGSERLAYTHTGGSRWLLPVLKEHMGNARNSTGSALNFFKTYISKVAQRNTPRNAEAEEPRTEEPHQESLTIVSGAALSANLQERNVGLNSDGNPNRNPVGGIPLLHAPGELPSDIPPRERLRRAFRRALNVVRMTSQTGPEIPLQFSRNASFVHEFNMSRDFSVDDPTQTEAQTDIPMLRRLKNTETLTKHHALVKHLQFCPSGQYLATCSWDSTALIWGVRNQRFRIPGAEVVLEHTLHHQPQIGGFVNQVAWSPTGDQLLVRFVKSLQLCDPKTGAYTKRFNRGRNVQATTWIPQSSSFLSVEWKIESNQAENRVYHVESIMGSDLVVLGTGEEEPRICHLPDLQVWDAAVMPDGYRVVVVATLLRSQSKCRPIKARHERRILIFNLETGSRESQVPLFEDFRDITLTTKGDYALMSCESKASPQGWRIDKILEEGYHRIALAHTYFPKDKVSIINDSSAITHQVYYAAPASFGGTDDQFVLAASKGNEIYIWERLSGILLHTIKTPDQELTNLAWNNTPPSGLIMLASAARDGTVRVWTAAASAGFSGADLPQPLSPETRTEPTSLATRQTNTRFQTKPNAR